MCVSVCVFVRERECVCVSVVCVCVLCVCVCRECSVRVIFNAYTHINLECCHLSPSHPTPPGDTGHGRDGSQGANVCCRAVQSPPASVALPVSHGNQPVGCGGGHHRQHGVHRGRERRILKTRDDRKIRCFSRPLERGSRDVYGEERSGRGRCRRSVFAISLMSVKQGSIKHFFCPTTHFETFFSE